MTSKGRGPIVVFVALATLAGARGQAQAPQASDVILPATGYFAGHGVAIGECAPEGMLGPKKPCGAGKGSAKFLFRQDLADGRYLLRIEYLSPDARPILLRVDDGPVTRALEAAAPSPRWEKAGEYDLGGVFTTVEIESVGSFPAIGALRLTKIEAGSEESRGGR